MLPINVEYPTWKVKKFDVYFNNPSGLVNGQNLTYY